MKTILLVFFLNWVKIPERITLEEERFISSLWWRTGHGGWGSFCGGPNLCCYLFCFVLLYFSPYTRKQRDKIRRVKEAITLNARRSNALPPARLQLLKVPQPLRTAPPSGDQVNTHMSLRGTFYVQTITKSTRRLFLPTLSRSCTERYWRPLGCIPHKLEQPGYVCSYSVSMNNN